jgi:hyperosmotically inducible protein
MALTPIVSSRDRAALAEAGGSAAPDLPALAARRLEAVRDGIKKAGVDAGRLKEVAASPAPSEGEGQVKLDLIEPEKPRFPRTAQSLEAPPGRSGFRRARGRGTEMSASTAAEYSAARIRVTRAWRWLSALVLIVIVAVGSGCASRDPWQDARIESEVKARLVEEKSANLTRLGVVSRQAVVRLTGTVSSEEQKALAERVAKSVGGVRRIENALDVRPAPG